MYSMAPLKHSMTLILISQCMTYLHKKKTDLWAQTVNTLYSLAQDERSTARDDVFVTEGSDSGSRSLRWLLLHTALWTQMAVWDKTEC